MKYTFLLFLLFVSIVPAQAAQSAILFDDAIGPYKVVATLGPTPLTVGLADLQVTVTDPATGQPVPVAAVYVTIYSEKLGTAEQFLAPPLEDRSNGVFESYRLHFPVSGNWRVAIQILDATQIHEEQIPIYIRPVTSRIAEAALVAVPGTLLGLFGVYMGYRYWQRKQAEAETEEA